MADECEVVERREKWGAVPPLRPGEPMELPVDSVVLAFNTGEQVSSKSSHCKSSLLRLQERHMKNGEPDIWYNFMVCGDGKLYEGRGWKSKPASCLKYSSEYGKIIVIGMFGSREGDAKDVNDDEGGDWRIKKMLEPTLKFLNMSSEKNLILDIGNVYEED